VLSREKAGHSQRAVLRTYQYMIAGCDLQTRLAADNSTRYMPICDRSYICLWVERSACVEDLGKLGAERHIRKRRTHHMAGASGTMLAGHCPHSAEPEVGLLVWN